MKPRNFVVRLLRTAEEDLKDIVLYLSAEDPAAADIFMVRTEKKLSSLAHHPFLGRVPDDEKLVQLGYRFLVLQNYLIFYTVEDRAVLIHRILHGARDYLGLL